MRLIFRQEGRQDRALESQESCPRVGDYVSAKAGEMEPIRGKVVEIEWTLESKFQAQAIITLL
jgi:hypothetical protein